MTPVLGFDTETFLIGPQNLAPEIVCLTLSCKDAQELTAVADGTIDDAIRVLFDQPMVKVAHNAPFDLAVLARRCPHLMPEIFDQLSKGLIADTKVREKLLILATTGLFVLNGEEYMTLPDGVTVKIKYSLADLVKKYFGVDLSAEKTAEDAWRLNYKELVAVPSAQWPEDAKKYAINDAVYTEQIYYRQEEWREQIKTERGFDPLAVENFQVSVAFALHLMAMWGIAVDRDKVAVIEMMLQQELAPEKVQALVDAGILKPAVPPQPYKNGAKEHLTTCNNTKTCSCPPKMSGGTKEAVSLTMLREHVKKLAAENSSIQLAYTDKSEKFPEGQVSVNDAWLTDNAHLSPILQQYHARGQLQKLVTTELPRMKWEGQVAPIVHPGYDVLKATGRTSSMASKILPSFNCQNVDPRVRDCYVAREGYWLWSADYSSMELGTLAQKCIDLFGFSTLGDLINSDQDPHEFLGAQIAFETNEGFKKSCVDNGAVEPRAIFAAFHLCKEHPEQPIRDFWKHYRTLAKPTGLGYPGGLGPDTFVTYAKATFGVTIDRERAAHLRELWKRSFPEMPLYLDWINKQCQDPHNGNRTIKDPESGMDKIVKKYAYFSPMGMYRAGCDYCAAANGAALQTPSAEGAKLAVWNVVRACYDPTLSSILYPDDKGVTVKPILFVHDEIVGEVRIDEHVHDRMAEVKRIMEESMRTITPKVTAKAQPVLMERWNKDAKPVYDANNRLTVWRPKP